MIDTTSVNAYIKLKPGDLVSLTDEQTILDMIEQKGAKSLKGRSLVINHVEEVRTDHYKLLIFHFEEDVNLVMIVKIVGDLFDVRVYFQPDDFQPGDRWNLIENQCHFLFTEPEDVNDFVPGELDFTDNIHQEVDGQQVIYHDEIGVQHGEARSTEMSGVHFATVVEYNADRNVANPRLIVLEYGAVDPDDGPKEEGGYVQFLQGADISTSDVQLFIQ